MDILRDILFNFGIFQIVLCDGTDTRKLNGESGNLREANWFSKTNFIFSFKQFTWHPHLELVIVTVIIGWGYSNNKTASIVESDAFWLHVCVLKKDRSLICDCDAESLNGQMPGV